MKKYLPIVALLSLFASSFFRCQSPNTLPATLLVDSLIHLTEQQEVTIDSLGIVINRLQTPPAEEETSTAPSLSAKDRAVQQMVYNMHKSWAELPGSKDPDLILQFFLPRFLTQAIAVKADNSAEARSYTHEDFDSYLKDIGKDKRSSYTFFNVDFLDIQTKGEYFNTVYTTDIDVKSDGELIHKVHVIVTVTGKRVDAAWKIAHYSWVEFQYE